MPKREAELKAALMKELKKQCPGFYILEFATRAAPDRAIVGAGRFSSWEFKHANPRFDSPGDQELMCMRMAKACHCRYVIWQEAYGFEKTLVVHPANVHDKTYTTEFECPGFDHKKLAAFIKEYHNS